MSIYSKRGGSRILLAPASRACLFACLAMSVTLLGMPSLTAHHARPEYDRNAQISITGTVMEFELVNPHAWIHIVVPADGGETENWSFEGGSVGRLRRVGWTRDMLKPGDNVKVLFNPRHDGSPGGLFRAVTTADGKYYSASRRRINVRF